MSTLSNLSNYGTDYQIGEVVNVLTGGAGSEATVALTSGGFIKCGQVYNQADYPLLYAKIGNINAERLNTAVIPDTFQEIAYGNGTYVAVGDTGLNGAAYYSTDLSTWTATTSTFTSNPLEYVAYGNGIFVAGGRGTGIVRYSSDNGVTWSSVSIGVAETVTYIMFDGTKFLFFTASGKIYSSTNATTWTLVTSTSPATSACYSVTYKDGQYIAAVANSGVYASTDLTTWTTKYTGNITTALSYGNGIYVTVVNNTFVIYSSNLTTWNTYSQFGSIDVYECVYDTYNGIFLIGTMSGPDGAGVYYSTDGASWTRLYYDPAPYSPIRYINGNVISLVNSSTITYTSNIFKYVGATYNGNTQFYVPNATFSTSGMTASGWTIPRTEAVWQSYIRAK